MENGNEMTVERSLKIIRDSIERSRKETTRQVGKPLLMWGVLVAVTSLVIGWLLWRTDNEKWNYLWFVFGIVGGVGQYLISRREKARVKNFTSDVVGNIWISFAIFCFCTFVINIIGILAMFVRGWMGNCELPFSLPIAPIILMMEALCSTIMGLVLRNAWITTTAILSGILSTAVAIAMPDVRSMIAMAFAAVLNLIVPGLIIVLGNKNKEGDDVICSSR